MNARVRKWLPWLLLAAAAAATAVVYWPGLTGGWVFDDYPNIIQNNAIHITPGHSTLAAWVNAALSSPASFLHRPLASITFALNWYFGGGDPWPFKLTNVIIHLVNGVLLFCMLRALLRLLALRSGNGAFASAPTTPPDFSSFRGGPPSRTRNPSPGEAESAELDSGSPLSGVRNDEWTVADAGNPIPTPTLPLKGREKNGSSPASAGRGIEEDGFSPDPTTSPRAARDPLRPEGSAKHPPSSAGRGIEGDGFSPSPPASPRAARDPLRPEGGDKHLPSSAGRGIEGDGFPRIDDAAATRLALLVTAAWMLLPINLMAVLYVVQRMESLCQIFVLAGLWAYLHGRWMMLTAAGTRRERRGFALAVAGIVFGTLLGLTSKETAVLLPVFAFLAEWILLRFRRGTEPSAAPSGHPLSAGEGSREVNPPTSAGRGIEGDGPAHLETHPPSPAARPPSFRRGYTPLGATRHHGALGHGWRFLPRGEGKTDKRIVGMFVLTLFIPAVLGFLWLLNRALAPGAFSGRDFTLGQRLLTEPRVLVDYLHWTLFPDPNVLSLYHDEIVKSTGLLTPWTTLGAIFLLAALIAIAVLLRNRRPLVSLGIGWFLGAQLLTATIVPLELVYEQRMYFASIGVLLAAGALLLGVRTRIRFPLLRGVIVVAALIWFGAATYSRAKEWSNPIQLAVAEANRHPTSPRAVYEAGRLLLIASNYQPGKQLDAAWKYLQRASVIPGASALSEQAMIMIADHEHEGDDDAVWRSMTRKLRDQPTRQEDLSALISLTNCYGAGICKFDVSKLQRAYLAALSRPYPIARLYGAYAAFQRDIVHDDKLAETYFERAVGRAPDESAYRIDLATLYARHGQTERAREQIDALRRMNLAGRLDSQIAVLEQLTKSGAVSRPQ